MSLDLEAAAEGFANELQQLLDVVLPYAADADPADRQVTVTASKLAFAVELGTASGAKAKTIPLLHQGARAAELFISMRLVADSKDAYLAVDKSTFELRLARHPLLRLDFVREMHTVPSCHWNVHGEREAVARLLLQGNPAHAGTLSKVHLPVGGHRMRPCLEDVLQLLMVEFRFDTLPAAQAAIDAGRIRWRRRQHASMTRDDPEEAVRVLRDLAMDRDAALVAEHYDLIACLDHVETSLARLGNDLLQ